MDSSDAQTLAAFVDMEVTAGEAELKQNASNRARLLPRSALPPANLATEPSDRLFCIRGRTVDSVCTAVDRSLVAAVQARRLCRTAAKVFDKEAKEISDAKDTFMNVVHI